MAHDHVISQSIAAGTQVTQGTAVSYVISLGVQSVGVPDVSGMTQTAADAALTTAGLSIDSIHQEYIDTHPAGSVIRGAEPIPAISCNFENLASFIS